MKALIQIHVLIEINFLVLYSIQKGVVWIFLSRVLDIKDVL